MERKIKRNTIRYIAVLICVLLLFSLLPHQSVYAAELGYGDRFGYSQLATDAQRRAYVILEEHIQNVSAYFIVASGESITIDDMKAATDALILDRHDFFYFIYGNLHIAQFRDGSLAVNPRLMGKRVSVAAMLLSRQ